MISIPPYILLIPFGLFLAAFAFFAFANILSLVKYGARNMVGLTATFLFVCGTAVILFLAWRSLGGVDWRTGVPLFTASSVGF
jgi:uncharacterized membrane protein YfcA